MIDPVAAVETGVVDEPLPSDHGARLLEVHTHHHEQARRISTRYFGEPFCVVERGAGIVDRARPGDHEQPLVGAEQDVAHGRARVRNELRGGGGERNFLGEDCGGNQRPGARDAQVARHRHRAVANAGFMAMCLTG
jgi:hypothetical protein